MGRLESLTAWALGRGPYESEVIQMPDTSRPHAQQYNERGHPRNPETRRMERMMVLAANEVMQVTGVVEDSSVARSKAKEYLERKNEDTFLGLRLMDAGRASLVGGVWGVLGLRRRILLYKPYSEVGLLQIFRYEKESGFTLPNLFFSGIPTVLAYHASDWIGFIVQSVIDGVWDEEEGVYTPAQLWLKHASQTVLDVTFCFITLHSRMFAILQQLNLIPGSRLLPSLRSFVPFTQHSPLQLPIFPSLNPSSMLIWDLLSYGSALLGTAAPMLSILAHGKFKFFIAKLLYRPIYKSLPRPTGDSMFSGLPVAPPLIEFDTPDAGMNAAINPNVNTSIHEDSHDAVNANATGNQDRRLRRQDTDTLRALEGLPADNVREDIRQFMIEEAETHSSDDEDDENNEIQQATLISFDVEATEPIENATGTWSAELRSANEPKPSASTQYRVTGLTMLPPILATEGLREILAGILVMPLEAIMVRTIGRAYRASAGLSLSPIYEVFAVRETLPAFSNLVGAFAVQVLVTGAIWGIFAVGSQWWNIRRQRQAEVEGIPLYDLMEQVVLNG